VSVVFAIVPAGVLLVNTDVKAVEPPELAVPLTTLKDLSLCVVCFVHPVGAAVCWNNIKVPTTKPGILVRFAPETAGNVAGNLASGIVPDPKLEALIAEEEIYIQQWRDSLTQEQINSI
jgi:hypothetical protein